MSAVTIAKAEAIVETLEGTLDELYGATPMCAGEARGVSDSIAEVRANLAAATQLLRCEKHGVR